MVLGITFFTSARTLVSDIIKQYAEQAVLQFGNNVTTELNKVTETANSFLFSTVVQDGFSDYDQMEIFDRGVAYNEISKEMNIIISQNRTLLEMRIHSPSNSVIYVGSTNRDTNYDELQ